MDTAIIMMSTIVVDESSNLFKKNLLTNNDIRYKQYLKGIEQFAKISCKYKYPIILVDNSIPNDKIPKELKDLLNKYNIKYLYCPPQDENYGGINKGAGILHVWKQIITLLKGFKYIIHFEPRQFMHTDLLISEFHKNKGNYCKKRTNIGGIETGFFAIESRILVNYANKSCPKNMCNKHISLENDILIYLIKNKHSFTNIPSLGLYWYFCRRGPYNPKSI